MVIRNWTGDSVTPRPDFFLDLWETPMRIPDKVLECTVFLGSIESGHFVPYGTGFMGGINVNGRFFQQIITARHVLDRIKPGRICVRINRIDGRVEQFNADHKNWLYHPDPDVDIAVFPTHVPPEQYAIRHVNFDTELATPEVFEKHDIGIGEEVFMAGLYTEHPGVTTNTPIVRVGNLAAIPKEKVETGRGFVHAYLVEARSIGGLSGSPVFLNMAPFRLTGVADVTPTEGMRHYFLGMMQGHHVTANPVDVTSPSKKWSPADMNTGIGVVIPAHQILEVLNTPELVKRRVEIAEKAKANSSFVFDAAGPSPSTKADNPSHKEDFNSLLTSAAIAKQSDDQT